MTMASFINLDGFQYDTSHNVILNWLDSIIILSYLEFSELSKYVTNWIDKTDSILGFDYTAIADDLNLLKSSAVLRYLPCGDGYDEALAVVGNKDFLEENVNKFLSKIDNISII